MTPTPTPTPEQLIQKLIATKSVASPKDIALALAIHPQVIQDLGSLEALQRLERLDQLSLSNVEQVGSVTFSGFRADWSCCASGYGYRNTVQDFRTGFWSMCGSPSTKPCLRVHVS